MAQRRIGSRLKRTGKLLLCAVLTATALAAVWTWTRRAGVPSEMEVGNRHVQLGVSTPACPICSKCKDGRPDCASPGIAPKPLPAWPGLLRSTQAVELELWLDANAHVGSCFEGKNMLSSSKHTHCATLYCMYSETAGFKVDLSNDLLSYLPDDAYPDECPFPRGGQKPLAASPAAASTAATTAVGQAGGRTHVAPQVSFIITIHNSIALACRCIVELFRTAQEAKSAEWVIVDDGSTDDASLLDATVERMQALFGIRMQLIRNTEPEGFGAANMRAVAASSGEFLAIINSDLMVQPGWLWALLKTFDDRPKAGLVGPLFLGDGHLITEAGGAVWADASAANVGRGQNASTEYLYSRQVDYVSAACNLVRRDLFLRIGGFDPVYGKGFYEDTDLSMAVVREGFLVLYQPLSVVYHQEGTTLGTDNSLLKMSLMTANKNIFRRKWDKVLTRFHCPRGTLVSLLARRPQQPRILWIDDLVPEPDHDSGSIRTMQMLRILIRQGYAVTFMATGDPMASEANRARHLRYVSQARFLGAEVLPPLESRQMPMDWLAYHGGHWVVGCPWQAIIVARSYIFDLWNSTVHEMCPGTAVLYDTVDLHFLREARDQLVLKQDSENLLDFQKLHYTEVIKALSLKPAGDALRVQLARDLAYIDQVAATMVVSEEELLMVRHYRPKAKVFLVSNIHEIEKLDTSCDGRSGVLFVANFQHPPNQRAVRFLIQDVLPAVLALLPPEQASSFVVHIVGSNLVPADLRILMVTAPRVVFHGHLSDESLRLLHFKVKAVVAPLLSGAGVKGKVNAALKLGVPAVVTPVAAEGMYLVDRQNAIIAASADTFAQAIVDVSSDCGLWKSLVTAGHMTMRAHFSIEVAEEQLLLVMDSVGLEAAPPGKVRCVVPHPPPPLEYLPAQRF